MIKVCIHIEKLKSSCDLNTGPWTSAVLAISHIFPSVHPFTYPLSVFWGYVQIKWQLSLCVPLSPSLCLTSIRVQYYCFLNFLRQHWLTQKCTDLHCASGWVLTNATLTFIKITFFPESSLILCQLKNLVVKDLILWKCFEYQRFVFYLLQQLASLCSIVCFLSLTTQLFILKSCTSTEKLQE